MSTCADCGFETGIRCLPGQCGFAGASQYEHALAYANKYEAEFAGAQGRAEAAYKLLDKMRRVANNTDLSLPDRCAALLMLTESSKNLEQPSEANEYTKWQFVYSRMKEWIMEGPTETLALHTKFIEAMSDWLGELRKKLE